MYTYYYTIFDGNKAEQHFASNAKKGDLQDLTAIVIECEHSITWSNSYEAAKMVSAKFIRPLLKEMYANIQYFYIEVEMYDSGDMIFTAKYYTFSM